MTDRIFDIYRNLPVRSVVSTFRECSIDRNGGFPLVDNQTECINFDEAKKALDYDREPQSVDSLSLACVDNGLLFIEFKNSYFDKVKTEIVDKGISSLRIHEAIVSPKIEGDRKTDNILVSVLSYDKNRPSNNDPRTVMMARAGYTVPGKYLEEYSKRMEGIWNKRSPELSQGYSKFLVVLSNRFDEFVNAFVNKD